VGGCIRRNGQILRKNVRIFSKSLLSAGGHILSYMEFKFKIVINKPPETVFAFFRDVDKHAACKGSIIPEYFTITPSPRRVGTQYLEVVQFSPFVRGKVLSEVVGLEPNWQL